MREIGCPMPRFCLLQRRDYLRRRKVESECCQRCYDALLLFLLPVVNVLFCSFFLQIPVNDDKDADVVVAAAVEDVDDVLYILTTSCLFFLADTHAKVRRSLLDLDPAAVPDFPVCDGVPGGKGRKS